MIVIIKILVSFIVMAVFWSFVTVLLYLVDLYYGPEIFKQNKGIDLSKNDECIVCGRKVIRPESKGMDICLLCDGQKNLLLITLRR